MFAQWRIAYAELFCATRAREMRFCMTAGMPFFRYRSEVTKRSEDGTPNFQHCPQ
jgi:hypothetical protein